MVHSYPSKQYSDNWSQIFGNKPEKKKQIIAVPKALYFHLPGSDDIVRIHKQPNKRFDQLMIWCLVQCYWVFVLRMPQVTSKTYKRVLKLVLLMGNHDPTLLKDRDKQMYIIQCGSSNPSDYPRFLRNWFVW